MKNICVFIGASSGNDNVFTEEAINLGKEIAKHNLRLIYGGANVGLMGTLADTVIAYEAEAIGIMPHGSVLPEEISHQKLTQLHMVETMQERKKMMCELADAFIVMPGGLGTLEEFFEVWNSIKIGLYNKPIGLLNVDGYFDQLLDFLKNSVSKGFLKQEQLAVLKVADSAASLLLQLKSNNFLSTCTASAADTKSMFTY